MRESAEIMMGFLIALGICAVMFLLEKVNIKLEKIIELLKEQQK